MGVVVFGFRAPVLAVSRDEHRLAVPMIQLGLAVQNEEDANQVVQLVSCPIIEEVTTEQVLRGDFSRECLMQSLITGMEVMLVLKHVDAGILNAQPAARSAPRNAVLSVINDSGSGFTSASASSALNNQCGSVALIRPASRQVSVGRSSTKSSSTVAAAS